MVNHFLNPDKVLERKNYPAGQHGANKRRGKQSEYGVQLQEKQKKLNLLMEF